MTTTSLVVMGVAGSGKSTIAYRLANRLGWPMAEADEFHPQANIDKMSDGTPLTDEDRWPWLQALADWMAAEAAAGRSTVVTCSALKRSYRDLLRTAPGVRVRFVWLRGDAETIGARMLSRQDHFMPTTLLTSQFATLEPLTEDEDGVAVDVEQAADVVVSQAVQELGLG